MKYEKQNETRQPFFADGILVYLVWDYKVPFHRFLPVKQGLGETNFKEPRSRNAFLFWNSNERLFTVQVPTS